MQRILAIACVMFCCCLTVPALAQRTVTGTVSDINNEPLTGVSVVLKEQKSIGVLTDVNGRYKLTLPEDKEYTIGVSYIGYDAQEKKTKAGIRQSVVDFSLKESTVDLGVVVITGTRTPKLLKDAPIITRVITREEIQKVDATHIGDLLQTELPGIEFSYSMDQQVNLNVQGFGGNAVLFLMDGERVAGETLDNIDYTRLNLDNVERIEIIKGAASSLYGSNAVGGVVNIISKRPDEPWTANINGRIAPYQQQRYGGTVSFNSGRFSNSTSVQYTTADSIVMKHKGGAYDKVHGFSTWNVKDRFWYTPTERLTIIGHAGFFFRERESKPTANDRYRSYNGGLKGEYSINDNNNLEVAYVFDQYDKSDYTFATGYDVRDYSNVQNTLRALYSYSFGEKNALTFGGDYMRDYLMSYQFESNGNHRQYAADVFGQLDWTFADNFNVIAGLRYDYFSDKDVSRVTPKLGLMYKLNRFTLRGSYASGFRSPTLKEMYMNFNMGGIWDIIGNPDLKPESSNNFSLSAEYTKGYYNFSVTGYFNRVKNRISTVWNEELDGRLYVNTKELDIIGGDANASAKFPCGIGARLSYSYTHEHARKGQTLVDEPRPHTATARIEYDKSWKNYGLYVALNGRFLSKVNTNELVATKGPDTTKAVTYPGYTMWKLSVVQKVLKGVNITLAVDNLFNYVPSYYYANSPYTRGTEFSAGVSIDIDKFFK